MIKINKKKNFLFRSFILNVYGDFNGNFYVIYEKLFEEIYLFIFVYNKDIGIYVFFVRYIFSFYSFFYIIDLKFRVKIRVVLLLREFFDCFYLEIGLGD